MPVGKSFAMEKNTSEEMNERHLSEIRQADRIQRHNGEKLGKPKTRWSGITTMV